MPPEPLTPHTNFFGYLVDAGMEIDFLAEFARTIDTLLREAAAKPAASSAELPDSIAAIASDRADLYTELFPPLVHEAFVISVAIFMEREMRTYVDVLRMAFQTRLRFNDLNGSAIDRFRTYVEKVCTIDLGLPQAMWQDLDAVFAIRNCLVHAFGVTEEFRQLPAILAFIKRHRTPAIQDGRLKVSSETCTVLLRIIREVVDAIYGAALTHFPRHT